MEKIIKVAGAWELSWNTPIKEAELWNLVIRDFKVKDWYMWPVTGIKHMESHSVDLHERQNLKEILDENEDLIRVFFEPENLGYRQAKGLDLRELNHPDKAIYIFGSAHFNCASGNVRPQDIVVTIPTLDDKGVLWPHQCLAIAFYDRLVKKQWQ